MIWGLALFLSVFVPDPEFVTPLKVGADDRVSGFRHTAGTDASRADSHALVSFSIEHTNSLKVGIPSPLGQIVGVASPVSIDRAFVANFAARHEGNSLDYDCSGGW